MKYIFLNRYIPLVVIISAFLLSACTEKWDEHYNQDTFNLPEITLKEYIQGDPEISIFSKMLEISGYDDLLDASQSFTVWAPVNEALAEIDTTDSDLVLEIVRNHLARSRYSASSNEAKSVRMLNGKNIIFSNEASGYSFGNVQVLEANIPTENGLLHVIDGYTPYLANLWEYIGRKEGLDSLRVYLYGNTQKTFDPENSVEIGIDSSTNQPIYDSAFILRNPILEKLGDLNSEDYIYTAIMPTNTAWSNSYDHIKSFFNFPTLEGGTERMREMAQWTLVKDMLFSGYITDPGSLTRLVSTTGNVYYDPASLFINTVKDSASNGLAFITDQMPYTDILSWFKEIRIEAEDAEGRTNTAKKNIIYPKNSYGYGLDVSQDRYILVDPVADEGSVTFTIPNVLSATYNIYCVFVPASMIDPTNQIPTKVSFKLEYIRRANGSVFFRTITPDVNETFAFGLTKMYVDQFDFQFANVSDDDYERVTTKLEVINEVSIAEEQAGTYSRTMRIDCIILEPVTQ